MAARKSARRAAPKPVKVSEAVERATEVVSGIFSPDKDQRPDGWLRILSAYANGGVPSRLDRPLMDDRFTGPRRNDQVKALLAIGMNVEDSCKAILKAAMDEHRGEKHCNW
jgi:hypothetical protein